MIPQPTYEIGQKVWRGTIGHGSVDIPCPDCLGTRKWKAITPAGTELEAECGRCGRWANRDLPPLKQIKWSGSAECLTIGSVRVDTNDAERPISYMCRETGVGSGSVYYERDLFLTEQEAKASADMRAAAKTAEENAKPEMVRAQKVGQLLLTEAIFTETRDSLHDAWWTQRSLREDVERVVENFGREAKADLEWALEWRGKRDKNPVDDLVIAARVLAEQAGPDAAKDVLAALDAMDPRVRKRPAEPQAEAAE